ncbi:MAG: metallophosphoesterase family protein [Firmicutes bacterium]|nr:metallophosphoesterase family protein [Bacillota bacterium]
MRIKLIHTADLHGGHLSTGGGFRADAGSVRRREILTALQNICDTAEQEEADFLLISGDLAEETLREQDWDKISRMFERIAPVIVVWSRGEADWDAPVRSWPSNVYAVEPGFHRLDFPEKKTTLWAESWGREQWLDGFYEYIPAAGPKTFHLLMVHGEADGQVHPIDMNALKSLGADYCALGHRHKMTIWGRENDVWAAYPGSPEPLEYSEEGDHGFLVVTLEKDEDYQIRSVQRKICAKRKAISQVVNVTADHDLQGVLDQIREAFTPQMRQRDLCRAVLKGCRKSFTSLDTQQMMGLLSPEEFLFLDVVDETQPELDFDKLREANAENLLGKYIAAMQLQIQAAGSEKERKTLEAALAAGVEVLMN